MDFNFPSETEDKITRGGVKTNILNPTTTTAASSVNTGNIGNIDMQKEGFQGHSGQDHSPSKLIDISSGDNGKFTSQHHQSGSTDDFEHVYNDESLLPTAAVIQKVSDLDNAATNMMEEFLGTTKTNFDNFKNDAFNAFENTASNIVDNFDKKVNQTIDFMNAERCGMSSGNNTVMPIKTEKIIDTTTTTKPITISTDNNSAYSDAITNIQNPSPSSYESSTDYQREHYNPSPIKKSLKKEDDEKFISSEDLLGDFKDERMSTPEHKPSSLASEPKIETKPESAAASNVLHHSGVENLTIDNDSISVTVKEDNSKISGLGKEEKPQKIEENKPAATIASATSVINETIKKPSPSSSSSVEKTTDKSMATTKKVEPASKQQMISAEEIFYKFGLGKCLYNLWI